MDEGQWTRDEKEMPKQLMIKIKDRLGDKIKEVQEPSRKRVYLTVAKKDIREVCGCLFNEFNARFIIASGMDNIEDMEILYHFMIEDVSKVISVRVFLGKESLEVDSIASVIKGSEWIEREMHELLGINFKGHPNLKPLRLPEDWPEGQYQLRKDFEVH